MTRYWAHDTREPLRSAVATSQRQIGVLASKPFHHPGMNAPYVDVSRETVTVNTATYGYYYPAEQAAEKIRTATEATIADLDLVIAELTAHRERLNAELPAGVLAEKRCTCAGRRAQADCPEHGWGEHARRACLPSATAVTQEMTR